MTNTFKAVNSVIEILLVGIFTIMVVNVLWQVTSRYLIGNPSSFTEELARFSLIWLSVLGAAYINGKRAHISIDYFFKKISPHNQAKVTIFIESLILLFALIVMVMGGGNLVYITLHLGQTSAALHLPLGYVYSIVPFSGVLIVFYSIHTIYEHF